MSDLRGPVLALDTSGPRASAALFQGGEPVQVEGAEGARAGSVVHGLVDRLLAEAGLGPRGLGRLAVVRGPGSFTGLRVGLAAIRGLSAATGVRALGLETTRAIALAAR